MVAMVLGGTQFMGRHMINQLLESKTPSYARVYMINRNHSAVPPEFKPALASGRLVHLRCDRMKEQERFKDLLGKHGPYHVVVDFIGFHGTYSRDAVLALHEWGDKSKGTKEHWKVGTYVHISTDSVYQAMPLPQDGGKPLDEQCCFRPETQVEEKEHDKIAGRTAVGRYQLRYARNKLTCEEALWDAFQTDQFPVVVLRIPDVYGPYDNLGGFWQHFVLPILQGGAVAAHLPENRMRPRNGPDGPAMDGAQHKMSWAFAPDVAAAVIAVTLPP